MLLCARCYLVYVTRVHTDRFTTDTRIHGSHKSLARFKGDYFFICNYSFVPDNQRLGGWVKNQ